MNQRPEDDDAFAEELWEEGDDDDVDDVDDADSDEAADDDADDGLVDWVGKNGSISQCSGAEFHRSRGSSDDFACCQELRCAQLEITRLLDVNSVQTGYRASTGP